MATRQPPPPFSLESLNDFPLASAQSSPPSTPLVPQAAVPSENPPENVLESSIPLPPLPKPATPLEAGPRGWKTVLGQNGKPTVKFQLRFIPPTLKDENTFGVCSSDAVKGELVVLDLTLVGFFLGKRPSFSFVKSTLLRLWKLQGNVEIMQLPHGGYAFRFSNLEDRDNILDGEVVFIGGQPMFIRQWDRSLHTGGVLGLRNVPLWVNLPGLPLHLWGEESLSAICSVLGTPLYSDKTTALKTRLMFARVCIDFSGHLPLLDSISIEDDIGMHYEQKVVYEWKPPHCISCGVFGHSECCIKAVEVNGIPAQNDDKIADGAAAKLAVDRQVSSCPGAPGQVEGAVPLSSGEEEASDLSWKVVRARKKRSSGSGEKPRPESHFQHVGDKAVADQPGSLGVLKPHWSAPAQPLPAQVCASVGSPPIAKNSKSLSTSQKAACPPSSLGSMDSVGVCLNSNSAQVDHAVQKHLNPCGPLSPRSSAGHTPFPSRFSQMARDLRLGRVGRTSGFMPKTPTFSAGPECGLNEGENNSNSSGLGWQFGLNSDASDGLQKEYILPKPSAEIGGCNMAVGRGLSWSVNHESQKEIFSPSLVDRGKKNGIPSMQNDPHLTENLLTELEGGNGHEGRKEVNGSLDNILGRCAGRPRVC